MTGIVEICTEQTKSFPQKHPLHSSAILHSSIALCWFVPGTPISPPHSEPACTLLQQPHLCHSFNPSHNPSTFPSFSTEMSSRGDGTREVHILVRRRESQASAGSSKMRCEHDSEQIMFSKNCQEYGSTHSEQMELNLMTTAYHLELPMCYRKSFP